MPRAFAPPARPGLELGELVGGQLAVEPAADGVRHRAEPLDALEHDLRALVGV